MHREIRYGQTDEVSDFCNPQDDNLSSNQKKESMRQWFEAIP